jgi:hydroxyethylthiazole kinase-like sugar kinase family protein
MVDTTGMGPDAAGVAAALSALGREDLELYAFANAVFLGNLADAAGAKAAETFGMFPPQLVDGIERVSVRVREEGERHALSRN